MALCCDHTIVPVTDKVTGTAFSEEYQHVTGISRALHRRN
jgi:hypothetical protein